MPRDVGVVIVAAGRGLRFGGARPKQYLELGGVPILLRALRPFVAHPEVAHVVVVLPAPDAAEPPPFLGEVAGGSLSIVAGGAERSDSVAAGLAALSPRCTVVLVHDAARPLITGEVINAVIGAARGGAAAVPAIPLGDTLKQAGDSGPGPARVVRTVPRDGLWLAQTPQGFPRAVLEAAHTSARRDQVAATDDAMLVERLGHAVVLVPGSRRNLKITTHEDLLLAEQML